MDNKNKLYLVVGSFVLLGFACIIGIWLWFSAANRQAFDTYRVIFQEPVDGVTTNSVVKYNGVEIGKVKEIDLDQKNPSNIFVYINVRQGVPIAIGTYATIKAQGVTGMSFINLSLDSTPKYVIVKPHNSAPYPDIQSRPSLLYSLSEQAQSVAGNIKDISVQVKSLLNDKNISHVANIVANLDKVSGALAAQSNQIGQAVEMVGEVLTNVNENTKNLNDAIIQLGSLSKSLEKNSAMLDKVLDSVQNNTLRSVNTVLLPNINQTVSNMSQSTAQLNELIRIVNQNPSVLVRGKTPAVAGPGE
jgi:phospholipid/cholesterol/gamma-HCH transport system substrate-binding protein